MERLAAKARRNLAARKSPQAGFTKAEVEALSNRYATFLDERDEQGFLSESCLSIHDPETPRPWLHLMGSVHDEAYGVAGSFWAERVSLRLRIASCSASSDIGIVNVDVVAGPSSIAAVTSYSRSLRCLNDRRKLV
jgi:hypothetical protein